VIPTVSLTLTVCCELLAPCQSPAVGTYPTIFTYHHDNGKTVRLGSDEHSQYNKPVNYDAVVQLFAERYPRSMLHADPVFDETQN